MKSSAGTSSLTNNTNPCHQEDIEDVFECPELPPPMKPFEDPTSQFSTENNSNQPTTPSKNKTLKESDFKEIEQIVKGNMVSYTLNFNEQVFQC